MERNIRWPHLPGHNKPPLPPPSRKKNVSPPPPCPIKTKAGPFRGQILNWHLPFMSQRNLRWFWSVLALPPPHICLSLFRLALLVDVSRGPSPLNIWQVQDLTSTYCFSCADNCCIIFNELAPRDQGERCQSGPSPPIYLSVLLTWYQSDISTWSVDFFSQAWSAQGDGTLGKNFSPSWLVL